MRSKKPANLESHSFKTRFGRIQMKGSGRDMSPKGRRWLIAVGIVLGALVLLQLVASPIATSLVNRKLSQLPDYTGNTAVVNVAFWRIGVNLTNLKLFERGHEQDQPLLQIKKASVRFAPGALFMGKLGGAAVIEGVELNVIKREGPDWDKTSEEMDRKIHEKKQEVQRWQNVLREAFPLILTRFEVKDATLKFVDRTHQPEVNIALQNIHILATDLQNRPKANGDPMPTRVDVTGVMTGNGQLKMHLRLDPIAQQPRFALNLEVRELQLPPLNSFLLASANADVSRGTFELYSEINARDGAYDGYVKPLFHDLDFKTASDKEKNFAEQVKEKVVSALATVLKNDEQNQVATKAPFAGSFAENDLDIWSTIVNLVRNAFVQAIRGGLEGQTPRG